MTNNKRVIPMRQEGEEWETSVRMPRKRHQMPSEEPHRPQTLFLGIRKKSLGGLLRASQGFVDCMRGASLFLWAEFLCQFACTLFVNCPGFVNEEFLGSTSPRGGDDRPRWLG